MVFYLYKSLSYLLKYVLSFYLILLASRFLILCLICFVTSVLFMVCARNVLYVFYTTKMSLSIVFFTALCTLSSRKVIYCMALATM